jgi:peroxiredoxin
MARRLDTVVNITILITCAAVLGTLAVRVAGSVRSRPAKADVLKPGDQFPSFEGVNVKDAERTLIMVGRADCRFCGESVPFYRHLSAKFRDSRPTRLQLVLVTTDPVDVTKEYVKRNELSFDRIVNVSAPQRSQLKIPGTPTLYLVDRSGRIQKDWIGRLDNAGEQDVQSALVAVR